MAGDMIICRCEEVLRSQIIAAIEQGAKDIDGVKRRTRACMGFCQGRTCQELVARIICEQLSIDRASVKPMNSRPPARPLKVEELIGLCNREQ